LFFGSSRVSCLSSPLVDFGKKVLMVADVGSGFVIEADAEVLPEDAYSGGRRPR